MYQIMIVDDDPTSLAIGKALLEPTYKIILMKSGVQALGYLKNNPSPAIILLDLVMPGTSGFDVLKALQKDDQLKDIPVIFLTSVNDNNQEIECYLMGATDVIQKPVNPPLLKKKIAYQVEQLRMKEENNQMHTRIRELESLIHRCGAMLSGAVAEK